MSTAIDMQVDREWWVFSTCITDVTLLLQCRKTGDVGIVKDPSLDEWRDAFHAPGNPYPWQDASRVEVIRR
jgi:hypothetical protein